MADYHPRLMRRLGMQVLASELMGVSCLVPLPIPGVCKWTGIVCLSHSRTGKHHRDPHNKHRLVPHRQRRPVQSLWRHLVLHIRDHQVLRTWHRPAPRTAVPLVLRSRLRPESSDRHQLPGLWCSRKQQQRKEMPVTTSVVSSDASFVSCELKSKTLSVRQIYFSRMSACGRIRLPDEG